jgi:tRNA threonylcarbamoyladenosine biosynthesis protein TsaE
MKTLILEKISRNPEDTFKIAEEFINSLEDKNCILILSGELGAGKTHFTKGIFKSFNFEKYNEITSPTFDLVNTYNLNNFLIHHFDLYRIDKLNSDDEQWLYELLNDVSLCIIEWGNKFEFHINKKIYEIEIIYLKENERQIKIFTN